MIPKDKAIILVSEFWSILPIDDRSVELAIKCSNKAVDKIIETHQHGTIIGLAGYNSKNTVDYWTEVKQELEKL